MREHEVGTAARRDALAFGVGDVAPALVALDDDLAGRALQLVVVVAPRGRRARSPSPPTRPMIVDATLPAGYCRCGLGHERDARRARDRAPSARVASSTVRGDVDEAVRLVGRGARRASADRRRRPARASTAYERRVGDERRVGVDRRRSIEIARSRPLRSKMLPRSALSGMVRSRWRERHRLVVVATQHLELGDPQRERGEHDHDEDRAHAEPPQRAWRRARSGARDARWKPRTRRASSETVARPAVAGRPVDAQRAAAADDG